MLMLSKLYSILERVLDFPDLHTAALLTVAGELVSYASEPGRPKDEIRVVVGLAGEVWRETREQGFGMVESEVSGILFRPTCVWRATGRPRRHLNAHIFGTRQLASHMCFVSYRTLTLARSSAGLW